MAGTTGTPGAGGGPSPSVAAAAPAAGEAGPPESLLQTLQSIWKDLPGLVSDRVEILSLELRRAGLALVQLVMLVVAVAILGVTAWLVLWAGVVALLVAAGLHLGWALLIVVALNVGAIVLALGRVRSLLPRLKLPATRRHLTLSPSPRTDPPEPPPHDRPDFNPAGQPAAR